MSRFLREPVSVRNAASLIVGATAVIVVVSGVLMRVLDHREFRSIGVGLWWAVQTVTTVGYGDVTPRNVVGRIVAAVVMLEGVAIVAIITAAITSSFVARAQREHSSVLTEVASDDRAAADARFDDLAERLDRIEALLRAPAGTIPS